VRICALGDLLLDVIVRVEEPIVPGADAAATTRAGAGGQAANVTAWAVELGADARFVGKRGDDAAGGLVSAELARRGVDVRGPVESGRNGVVVSLVDGSGERTMLSDRGVAADLRADELEPRPPPPCGPGGSASTSRRGPRSATSAPTGCASSWSGSGPTWCSGTTRSGTRSATSTRRCAS
jgi:hypothetical protein